MREKQVGEKNAWRNKYLMASRSSASASGQPWVGVCSYKYDVVEKAHVVEKTHKGRKGKGW